MIITCAIFEKYLILKKSNVKVPSVDFFFFFLPKGQTNFEIPLPFGRDCVSYELRLVGIIKKLKNRPINKWILDQISIFQTLSM